ncbi:hypothetical protein G6F65_016443 [Rhizopus arrhizus]|uniref:HTH crp-type domain-containing protein n=1 Tax=Rhizopus delemar TaxID=936053 RepID=A0A9P7C1G9_9FUNG|nr:hypothetical protein G6F23_015282 [Rhizopus arrhizus]KAG1256169.1 hypothetical protein G6F65_016443 [Rhizopus arrhizus]KAG1388280.1 hypothetical protein G6F58_013526 [Rhizopus delemar]KAG1531669.1 hypothetical protein G6F50_016573 [Rhizopus delemar]
MAANGYSPVAFTLKMTREDIASHLGMKVETVCRVLARLQVASMVKPQRSRVVPHATQRGTLMTGGEHHAA